MSQVIGVKVNNVIYDTQSASELGINGESIYFDNSGERSFLLCDTPVRI